MTISVAQGMLSRSSQDLFPVKLGEVAGAVRAARVVDKGPCIKLPVAGLVASLKASC